MIDFAAARRMMVDGQVRTADVTDRSLLGAMLELPRERFFPEDKASLAYLDLDANVSESGRAARHLLKPMVLAKLIQAAEISEGDRVLDLGCASGYSTAVLARLAAHAIGLEQDEALVRRATSLLSGLGIGNAKIVSGPLDRGWSADGPYDAIVLQGAAETAPAPLLAQLKDGGRMVCVLGRGPGAKAMLYRRIEGELSGRPIFDAAAPLLPGFAKVPAFVF